MGLEHEFYLVPDTVDVQEFWRLRDYNNVIDGVIIHDDMIQYIMDSLDWIPSINPSTSHNKNRRGINYYGITLFEQQSSELIIAIFTSWRNLFINGPKVLKLRGNFVFGENDEGGEYEKLIINRYELLIKIEKMISMAEKLSKGNLYLYHLGI
ncbi:hypothetical protein [Gottfriedia acidiceleris]|uniref:Uncharacterized protein n=1 Tax=Gottfriedia acidiceleris TaxID=371036 RepID=A0ABY4JRI6_9BACI|nr:hypothetical protein [Gottfriedia acidiceleris]UPM55458.1 hypothetical protein MY490_06345 [Gottfriedia acidiceleris]